MNLIDSHTHLNFHAFDNDWLEVAKRSWQEGVGFIVVGSNLATSKKAIALATDLPALLANRDLLIDLSVPGTNQKSQSKQHKNNPPQIYVAIGLHPIHLVRDIEEKEKFDGREYHFTTYAEKFNKPEFAKLAKHPSVVAIGEIGLDYFHFDDYRGSMQNREQFIDLQKKTLQEMLTFAQHVDKPVILHCRDAYDDLITILAQYPKIRGVVHCFSGTCEQAQKLLDFGFYLGITGIVTFPNAKELQQIVANLPLQKILIETDCPYLAPQPVRGQRNEPRYVHYVAEQIAALRQQPLAKIAAITTENARQLFRLF